MKPFINVLGLKNNRHAIMDASSEGGDDGKQGKQEARKRHAESLPHRPVSQTFRALRTTHVRLGSIHPPDDVREQ